MQAAPGALTRSCCTCVLQLHEGLDQGSKQLRPTNDSIILKFSADFRARPPHTTTLRARVSRRANIRHDFLWHPRCQACNHRVHARTRARTAPLHTDTHCADPSSGLSDLVATSLVHCDAPHCAAAAAASTLSWGAGSWGAGGPEAGGAGGKDVLRTCGRRSVVRQWCGSAAAAAAAGQAGTEKQANCVREQQLPL